MKIDLKNKTVWVVGASSGIGKGLVKHLAHENCNIILSARRKDKLLEIQNEYTLSNSNSLVLELDISKFEEFESKLEIIKNKFTTIDVLILNAGIAHKSLAEETLEAVDRQIMEVNFMGNILLSKKVVSLMKKQNSGTIAVTSSILGNFGLPMVSTYAASKHAVSGYYESLRYEVEKYGINITIISPGFIQTDITKNSLKGNGESFNKNSIAQEKGMNAELCAKKMIQAIKKGKRHQYIGGLEIFMPMFSFYFPRLFYFLMKKMHKI